MYRSISKSTKNYSDNALISKHKRRHKITIGIYLKRFRRIFEGTFKALHYNVGVPVDQFCSPFAVDFPVHPVVRAFEVMVAIINCKS